MDDPETMRELQEALIVWFASVQGDPSEIQFESHPRVNPDIRPNEFFRREEGMDYFRPMVFYRDVQAATPTSAPQSPDTAVVVTTGREAREPRRRAQARAQAAVAGIQEQDGEQANKQGDKQDDKEEDESRCLIM
ncbi:unnamed protein product [Vitrella brassicaformis CCMP3155]|uniref:Uncharacterized protein n=1 Tax=Vitrella brassicaformis (strain CCMP3155) TaxID=1169540 RepID=A0A0G4EYG8_VITBC|nr:unnamed protein product [Vitrella brassicaformis CCMP3155]|mmetsp:Transcript_1822/g.3965  ORF Transcript_1822/g.3965 Transcript_1822/m.3965 type:complete len:135 (-) Transcript_1822:91-495(-)|eukprot:CEM04088.1 unnamed protein product [Vitrella brassicaformis CCMP3155]